MSAKEALENRLPHGLLDVRLALIRTRGDDGGRRHGTHRTGVAGGTRGLGTGLGAAPDHGHQPPAGQGLHRLPLCDRQRRVRRQARPSPQGRRHREGGLRSRADLRGDAPGAQAPGRPLREPVGRHPPALRLQARGPAHSAHGKGRRAQPGRGHHRVLPPPRLQAFRALHRAPPGPLHQRRAGLRQDSRGPPRPQEAFRAASPPAGLLRHPGGRAAREQRHPGRASHRACQVPEDVRGHGPQGARRRQAHACRRQGGRNPLPRDRATAGPHGGGSEAGDRPPQPDPRAVRGPGLSPAGRPGLRHGKPPAGPPGPACRAAGLQAPRHRGAGHRHGPHARGHGGRPEGPAQPGPHRPGRHRGEGRGGDLPARRKPRPQAQACGPGQALRHA